MELSHAGSLRPMGQLLLVKREVVPYQPRQVTPLLPQSQPLPTPLHPPPQRWQGEPTAQLLQEPSVRALQLRRRGHVDTTRELLPLERREAAVRRPLAKRPEWGRLLVL